MTYRKAVQQKIDSSTARQDERAELWGEIAKAHEEGGARDVELVLTSKMEDLAVEFHHVLEKLERML
jgi:hypothetical protein